jgi:hypothetical protein
VIPEFEHIPRHTIQSKLQQKKDFWRLLGSHLLYINSIAYSLAQHDNNHANR